MLSTSLRAAPAVLLLPVLLALAACSQAQTPPGKSAAPPAASAAAAANKGDRPAVLKGIEKHGFEVVAEFDAPEGLRGFAAWSVASSRRRPMSLPMASTYWSAVCSTRKAMM